jgi:hypothetical protein
LELGAGRLPKRENQPAGAGVLTEASRNWTGAPRSPQRTWVEEDGAKPHDRFTRLSS